MVTVGHRFRRGMALLTLGSGLLLMGGLYAWGAEGRARVATRQVKEVSKPPGWRIASPEDFLMIVYGDPPDLAIVRAEDGDVRIPLTSDFVLASELLSPSVMPCDPRALYAQFVWGFGDVQEGEDAAIGLGSLSPKQLIELLRDGQTSFEASPGVVRPLRLNSRSEVAVAPRQGPDALTTSETEAAEMIEGDLVEIDAGDTGEGGTAATECAFTNECSPGGVCRLVCKNKPCSLGWFQGTGGCAKVTRENDDGSTTETCQCVAYL